MTDWWVAVTAFMAGVCFMGMLVAIVQTVGRW